MFYLCCTQTLFAENKEKLIKGTLVSLLDREDDTEGASVEELEAHFHALRRLVASKAGFMSFTQLPRMRERVGVKVVKALRRNNDGVTHAALDMLCALMQVRVHFNKYTCTLSSKRVDFSQKFKFFLFKILMLKH